MLFRTRRYYYARAAVRAFPSCKNFCTRASICSRSRSSSCVGVFMFLLRYLFFVGDPDGEIQNASTQKETKAARAFSKIRYPAKTKKRKEGYAFCAPRCVQACFVGLFLNLGRMERALWGVSIPLISFKRPLKKVQQEDFIPAMASINTLYPSLTSPPSM